MLGGISLWQLAIILVIVILLFGTKKLRNIGGVIEGDIVEDDWDFVFGQHHVLFDVVSTLGVCHGHGSQGMLGHISTGAPMCDHNGISQRRLGREQQRNEPTHQDTFLRMRLRRAGRCMPDLG